MDSIDFVDRFDEEWVLDDGHETVDFPEGDCYIVPIFTFPQYNSHTGCGIFVDNYLITVGHVALDSNKRPLLHVYVYYKGSYLQLTNADIIYDGRGNPDIDGVHDDLLIYHVNGIGSPFRLNEQSISIGQTLYTKPYDYIEEIDEVRQYGNECRITSLQGKVLYGEGYWRNCFSINNPCIYHPGNSGSALYCKNVVYGLLIGGDGTGDNGRWYTILDARYIKSKIDYY